MNDEENLEVEIVRKQPCRSFPSLRIGCNRYLFLQTNKSSRSEYTIEGSLN